MRWGGRWGVAGPTVAIRRDVLRSTLLNAGPLMVRTYGVVGASGPARAFSLYGNRMVIIANMRL